MTRSLPVVRTPFAQFHEGSSRFSCAGYHRKAGGSHWQKHKVSCVKLNLDGISKGASMTASIGGVYRDHRGEFLLGFGKPIGRATSSMSELTTARRGLELAQNNEYLNIWIERGVKIVVDLLSKGKFFRPQEVLDHAREIGSLMSEMNRIMVSHIPRERNRVADSLANMGHLSSSIRIWQDVPPDDID